MRIVFICALLISSAVLVQGSDDCARVPVEEVFLTVNETKVFDIYEMFKEHNTIIYGGAEAYSLPIGRVTQSELLNGRQNVTLPSTELIDAVQFRADGIISRIASEFIANVRKAYLHKVGNNYQVTVVDSPKYLLKIFQVADFQVFKPDEVEHWQCFSLAFLSLDSIVVDCANEETPLVIANHFIIFEYDEVLDAFTRQSVQNINAGQVRAVTKRKIRTLDDKLIRGHLVVDDLHLNQTYIEVFKYESNKFDIQFTIPFTQSQLINFRVNAEDLTILTNKQITIHPGAQVNATATIPHKCPTIQHFSEYEFSDDEYVFYIVCQNQVIQLTENQKEFVVFQDTRGINWLSPTEDYLLVGFVDEISVIDIESNLQVFVADNECHVGGTMIANEFFQICPNQTLTKGKIYPELMVLFPRVPHPPVDIQVYTQRENQTKCIGQFKVTVTPYANTELVDVSQEEQVELYKTKSTDAVWVGQKLEILYDDLVQGPDPTLKPSKNYTIQDRQSFNLASLGVELPQNYQMLSIDKIPHTNSRIQVFMKVGDDVQIHECVYLDKKLTCEQYQSPLKVPGMTKFAASPCHMRNATLFGIQEGSNSPKFYDLRRKGPNQASVHSFDVQISGSQWRIGHDFVYSYDNGVSDLSFYDVVEGKLVKTTTVDQDHFFDLLDLNEPIPWCVASAGNKLIVTTVKGIIYIEKVDGEWELVDVINFTPDEFDFKDLHFCHIIKEQAFIRANKQLFVFQLAPFVTPRGNLHLYEFDQGEALQTFTTSEFLYVLTDKALLQYSANMDESLDGALERIIDVNRVLQIVPFSMGTEEWVFMAQEKEEPQVLALHNKKKVIFHMNEHSQQFERNVTTELAFTNYFKKEKVVKLVETVFNTDIPTIPTKEQRLESSFVQQQGKTLVMKFLPEELFTGPLVNITVKEQGYRIINRVHEVGEAFQIDLVDLTFHKPQECLMLTQQELVSLKSNLTQIEKGIPLNLPNLSRPIAVNYDPDSGNVIILTKDHTGKLESILHGDVSKGIRSLQLTTVHLQQDWSSIVKYQLLGSYLIVVYEKKGIFMLKVLKPFKESIQEVFSQNIYDTVWPFTSVVDFDAQLEEKTINVIFKDDRNYLYPLVINRKQLRQRALQQTTTSKTILIQDALKKLNQPIFTDTEFSGIKMIPAEANEGILNNNYLLDYRVFVTTNNALQYLLSIKGTDVKIINTYQKLGSYAPYPQQLQYIAKFDTMAVTYIESLQQKIFQTAFYNLSLPTSTDPQPYYQVVQTTQPIGGDFVKVAGPVTATEASQAWPQQGGIITRSHDAPEMIKFSEVDEYASLEGIDPNLKQQMVTFIANGLYRQTVLPVQLNEAFYRDGGGSDPEIVGENEFQKKVQYFINSEYFFTIVMMLAAVVFVIVMFIIIRCYRRLALMREMKRKDMQAEMQDFTNDQL